MDPVARITGAQALTMAMKLCVAVLFGGKLKFANWAVLGAFVVLTIRKVRLCHFCANPFRDAAPEHATFTNN